MTSCVVQIRLEAQLCVTGECHICHGWLVPGSMDMALAFPFVAMGSVITSCLLSPAVGSEVVLSCGRHTSCSVPLPREADALQCSLQVLAQGNLVSGTRLTEVQGTRCGGQHLSE